MKSNIGNGTFVTFEVTDKRVVVGGQITDCVCCGLG